ncbi:MAG: hypothetical protein WC476_07355 [Phycisphaerae bacterium]|jgi:vacuolar-type H+-ATPase subunit H
MTPLPSEIEEMLAKFIAKVLGGPKAVFRCIAIASFSLAECLLGLINQGIINDIKRVKESLIHKMEADVDFAVAKARKKLAEAAEAANRANLHKRVDAIAQAEEELIRTRAAKTQAEADAIRKDAETRRLKTVADAKTGFLRAVKKLQQEGGNIFLDRDNLRKILEVGLPPEDYKDTPESDPDE